MDLRSSTIAFSLGLVPAGALAQAEPKQDLTSLGLEDLMKIQVVSATRSAQSLKNVAAAIYVLSGDEIIRSGAQVIPDMLRLVPGVLVARIDGNKWMVGIRGFASRYSNKLQVLIDGHSIYTPLFSGVNWDDFGVSPEDIDRIEVIRGPGGAIWGANAVNGVINIITKKAAATQGGMLELGAGDPLEKVARIRYGGAAGKNAFFRVYADQMGFDSLDPAMGGDGNDGWKALRGGFRLDGERGKENWSISGYGSHTELNQLSSFPSFDPPYVTIENSGWENSHWYLNAAWSKTHSASRNSEVHMSFADSNRNDPDIRSKRKTLDVEYKATNLSSNGSRTIWGVSFRQTSDQVEEIPGRIFFDPASKTDRTFGGFLHYERPLGRGLTFSAGSTIEHNDYTGFEVQPNLRLVWDKNHRETHWAALSRAVRVPSRAEHGATVYSFIGDLGLGMPVRAGAVFNRNIESEKLISFEIGSRFQPSDRSTYDIAAYVNWYDNLMSFEVVPVTVGTDPPHLDAPVQFGNKANAITGGLEVSAQFAIHPTWKLSFFGSLFTDKFELDSDSVEPDGELHRPERMGATPRYTFGVRSSHDFAKGVSFDMNAQFVDALPSLGIPDYTRIDIRLGWKPSRSFELNLIGQDLLYRRHVEGVSNLYESQSYVPRGWYFMGKWKF